MTSPFARSLAGRAVHLRITPRPSNLGESREIMRLISQFGEIEYFKNLKYDTLPAPNAALVIYKDENAAKACLRRSPIRFRMGKVGTKRQQQQLEQPVEESQKPADTSTERQLPRGPLGTPFGMPSSIQSRSLSTSSLPQPTPNPIRMPFDPPPPADPPADEGRMFQIQTNISRRHFRDHVDLGHYHGPFHIDSKMPGQEDLAKKVPILGLSCVDWRGVERPWHVASKERREEKDGRSLGSLAKERKTGQGEGAMGVVRDKGVFEAEGMQGLPSVHAFTPFGVKRDARKASAVGKDSKEQDNPDLLDRAGSIAVEGSDETGNSPTDSEGTTSASKGWENVFPGISNSVERPKRYSGR